jgi:Raf kinase inhibitor-like YbhB/YbcL family protein
MNSCARLAVLLCLAILLAGGCAPRQAPTPTTLPSQPEPAPTASKGLPTPTVVAPGVPATDTALPPPAAPTGTSIPPSPEAVPGLIMASTAFAPGGEIPVEHSCFGDNLSPPLAWSGVPEGTSSLALVVDDPDSQPPGFVHWVVYNIPATASGLPQGLPAQGQLGDGTLQGTNGFAASEGGTFPSGAVISGLGYAGPCPPGRHHYVFTLYALDGQLDLPSEATADQVLAAMQGHILTQALLAGVFTPPQ